MEDSPLALTDDELGKIYKAIAATQIRGGVTVRRGIGNTEPRWNVVAPALRARNEFTLATTFSSGDANVIMFAFNNLAFLIESLQSERAAHNALRHEITLADAVLDAHGAPAVPVGVPFTLHERVAEALEHRRCRVCGFETCGASLRVLKATGMHSNASGVPQQPNNGLAYCPTCDDETLIEVL